MRKVLFVIFSIFCINNSYSRGLRVTPYTGGTSINATERIFVEYGATYNNGKYFDFYDNLYAYNLSDQFVFFELTVQRCLRHALSNKKLSNKCSEETKIFRPIPPGSIRLVLFDPMKEWEDQSHALPYVDIPGNWACGFKILEFKVRTE